jgi:hypothetical protein
MNHEYLVHVRGGEREKNKEIRKERYGHKKQNSYMFIVLL